MTCILSAHSPGAKHCRQMCDSSCLIQGAKCRPLILGVRNVNKNSCEEYYGFLWSQSLVFILLLYVSCLHTTLLPDNVVSWWPNFPASYKYEVPCKQCLILTLVLYKVILNMGIYRRVMNLWLETFIISKHCADDVTHWKSLTLKG